MWLDSNANGVQDAGELGIQGVTVQLKDNTGAVVETQTTDVNGNYGFTVAPGTYSVAIIAPAFWRDGLVRLALPLAEHDWQRTTAFFKARLV